ncbi:MAG: hypothetical protein COA86_02695 [Kangiella sp.]|nr:MAG: hypothetical protein COA86_02695 [Kangiella sp.]
MDDEFLALDVVVNKKSAVALATFLKRVTWSEMKNCASSDEEIYTMRDGIVALEKALNEQGVYAL